MKAVFYSAESRGHFQNKWLETWYSFSFDQYRDPERMGFGMLRVLNDDTIAPGTGFPPHAHHNMEIITLVLKGSLLHEDDLGNRHLIHEGDIQVMSAGRGITHSESNPSNHSPVSLLQIWIRSRSKDIVPRYDQMNWSNSALKGSVRSLVSPEGKASGTLTIHQDAFLSLVELSENQQSPVALNKNRGVYLFVIQGIVKVDTQTLHARDALAISETAQFVIQSTEESRILLIDVPFE